MCRLVGLMGRIRHLWGTLHSLFFVGRLTGWRLWRFSFCIQRVYAVLKPPKYLGSLQVSKLCLDFQPVSREALIQ
jgi:hypothetical protein